MSFFVGTNHINVFYKRKSFHGYSIGRKTLNIFNTPKNLSVFYRPGNIYRSFIDGRLRKDFLIDEEILKLYYRP